MINMDMIGRVRDGKIYLSGTGTGSTFPKLVEEVKPPAPIKIDMAEKAGYGSSDHTSFTTKSVPVLFFFSGMPALIYQIVWQRVLFYIYGVNAESVAVVVSAFMLGLGLGFAAPVFILSLSPALQHILPKPGVWMVTLKQVLAFPLYATAAWLVWVLSIQAGSDGVMAAALAVVGIGFAAWLAHKTAFSSLAVKSIAPALAVATLAVTLPMAETAETVNPAAR